MYQQKEIEQKIFQITQSCGLVFVIANLKEKKIVYTNLQATNLYGFSTEDTNLDEILLNNTTPVTSFLDTELKEAKFMSFFNVMTRKKGGDLQLVDLHVGHFGDNEDEVFFEMIPKTDNRMEMTLNQIENSNRAEGVLEFDEKLSLIQANELFHAVFECTEEIRHGVYGNFFANGFHPDIREELLATIHAALKKSPNFSTKMKVITASGKTGRYSLELQRRTLDNSGRDKIMAYMVNIDEHEELESEHSILVDQLSAMQALTDDFLYHIDVKTGVFSHNVNLVRVDEPNISISNFKKVFIDSEIIHPEDAEQFLTYTKSLFHFNTKLEDCTVRASVTSYIYQWYSLRCKKRIDKNGELTHIFGALVNVQKEKDLERKANYDQLTNALNKGSFQGLVEDSLINNCDNSKFALLFVDLDDFKTVNDTYGHTFGDFVLAETGKRLKEFVRSTDIVGRVGGDEFVLFMKVIPSIEIARKKAEMLLEVMSREISDGTHSVQMNGSIGIAGCPDNGTTYEELYHHADLALYKSKEKGKNSATLYSE